MDLRKSNVCVCVPVFLYWLIRQLEIMLECHLHTYMYITGHNKRMQKLYCTFCMLKYICRVNIFDPQETFALHIPNVNCSKDFNAVMHVYLSDMLLFKKLFKKPEIMFVLNSVSVFKNLHISFFLLHIFLSHTFVKFYNDHKSFITSTKLIWMHFAKNLQSLTELSFLVFTYL